MVDDRWSGAVLTWTAPAATDVAAYRVYVDGTLVATAPGTEYRQPYAGYGMTYRYAVEAVDRAGNVSAAGTTSLTTKGDFVAPTPVTGVKATPREDGVLVEWTPNPENDIELYKVYKAEWYDDGEGTTGWVAHNVTLLTKDATSFLHESAADGETVLYGVIAIDNWNNYMDPMDPAMQWVEVTELGTPEAP
ncbi:hypothetical protein R1T08_22220 [Streptomyces sp. SBC-4]|nr:hypothetical protein [Streptomyces sp. SBC-4]MDV5146830.1 hypothetical protein [Streptomyces sp. SBC-4]